MNLAAHIDHTNLRPTCTSNDILQLCEEALQYQFASVCVPPNFVYLASEQLQNAPIAVCTVIGFPNGYATTKVKVAETEDAINNGAREIDMVIPIGLLKESAIEEVKQDIKSVHAVCKANHAILKVIIETALLSEEEKKTILSICATIGVDYVKTSTGFSDTGATIKDVSLFRTELPNHIKIKAAGGIKTIQFAKNLLEAGADRLGCSSSVEIMNQL